jgi:hypothetical protein
MLAKILKIMTNLTLMRKKTGRKYMHKTHLASPLFHYLPGFQYLQLRSSVKCSVKIQQKSNS